MSRNGKPPLVLDRPIAWVGHTEEVNGITEYVVERQGMSRDEMLHYFPGHWANGLEFARKDLIKAIIYEAYLEAKDGRERQRQNIRGFWYERIFYTLISVMGESGDARNIASIDSSINEAWRELVEGGYVTYSALNLYSEKENNYRIEVREDSPYPTAIVMVEKASLYDALNDLASTYEISFCCTGGQNSRAAALEYTAELERKKISLDRDFTVYSFCDFDPEGWIMPERFIDHLKLKITGNVTLIRLGVLKEHLGASVLAYQAIPYSLEAETKSAQKAKQTKYDNFVEATGGLFIPGPDGNMIPARVELNIYTDEQIRNRIIDGLSVHLDGFRYQVRAFKETIEQQYDYALQAVSSEIWQNATEEFEPYFTAIQQARDNLAQEELNRAIPERQTIAELERQIAELQLIVATETADLKEKDSKLRQLAGTVEELQTEAGRQLVEELSYADNLPNPDGLIGEIEGNGGWRKWAESLGLTVIKNDALAAAAQRREIFNARLAWKDVQGIRGWIQEEIDKADFYNCPDTPDESPEDMIARILGGQDEND